MSTKVVDFFKDYKLCEIPIYMVRIEIRVHHKRYSGTDDPVFVEIGNSTNNYYLNKGRDDFETSSYNYFSLKPVNVLTVKDLTRLRIGKTGNNQLRIRWVKIYINGSSNWIFKKDFGYSTGIAIDNGSSITISGDEIRRYYENERDISVRGILPKVLIDDEKHILRFCDTLVINELLFEELIETHFGNSIQSNGLYWGGKDGSKWVRSYHRSGYARSIIHTTVDLKYSASFGFLNLPDPEIDVAFDMHFISAIPGCIYCDTCNVSIDGNILLDIYATIFSSVKEAIHDEVSRMEKFDFSIRVNSLPGYNSSWRFIPTCPSFFITDGGTIKLTWK
jgi:hypothetical protein